MSSSSTIQDGSNVFVSQCMQMLENAQKPLKSEINTLKKELEEKNKLLEESRRTNQNLTSQLENVQIAKAQQAELAKLAAENAENKSQLVKLAEEKKYINVTVQAQRAELMKMRLDLKNAEVQSSEHQVKSMALEKQASMLAEERNECNSMVLELLCKLDPSFVPPQNENSLFAPSLADNLRKFKELLSLKSSKLQECISGFMNLCQFELNENLANTPSSSSMSASKNAVEPAPSSSTASVSTERLPSEINSEKNKDRTSRSSQVEKGLPSTRLNRKTNRRSHRIENLPVKVIKTTDHPLDEVLSESSPIREPLQGKPRRNPKPVQIEAKKPTQGSVHENKNVVKAEEEPPMELLEHKKDRSEGKREMHFCICGREYPTEQSLNNHISRFRPKRPIQCPFKRCGKVFGTSAELNKHCMDEHKTKKTFTRCQKCPKVFENRSQVYKHQLEEHEVDLTQDGDSNAVQDMDVDVTNDSEEYE